MKDAVQKWMVKKMDKCKNCFCLRACNEHYRVSESGIRNRSGECVGFVDSSKYSPIVRGRWIYSSTTPDDDGNLQAHCSVCGAGETHAATMVGKVHFCWECGSDMRGEEDG